MGLTVHFELECSGSAEDVKCKLEKVRSQVEDLQVEEVNDSPAGYGFVVHVGEGCQSLNIALTRLRDEEKWSGRAFCKTQYAREFIKCHLLVIAVLDLCKAEGILKSVSDESDYWETRDINVLAKSINESSAMLADFSKFLKKSLPKGMTIKAEIDECQNYVITEDMKRAQKGGDAQEKE